MTTKLTALVLGSGYAGQGHAEALHYCGVDVVGMVSRNQHTVEETAQKLNIPYASTNWEHALKDLQPTIVTIGTPGGAHFEPIMQALEHKAHVFCDKPLAETAEKAQLLYERAKALTVKTAYAASYRYQPNVLYARELIKQGRIGKPLEIECISHFNLDKLIPFGWSHQIEMGGGRLNNNFTHKLSIVEHLLDGKIMTVNGSVRRDLDRAPIIEGVHDFRTRRNFIPDEDDLDTVEWGESDAEWSYTITMELESPFAVKNVSTLFKHSALQPRFGEDHIVIYGDAGAIVMTGCYGQGELSIYNAQDEWEQKPVPSHISDQLPNITDDTQRNWTALMQEFVADIRGDTHNKYQSFKDGWQYQQIIANVRANDFSDS